MQFMDPQESIVRRIANIKRCILVDKKDADFFHNLARKYQRTGEVERARSALSAEKTCRENVSELERQLIDFTPSLNCPSCEGSGKSTESPLLSTLESDLCVTCYGTGSVMTEFHPRNVD